ncbi:hypothetical protein OIU79_002632 [Salix purpurea]|uniref:Uncharacterized protein n=1 Tax=Salix purpurea TaxID=77065 RepID=A0A9Q0UJZ2_SALPP|nr:hypothetical protein OIU79_002632 [Salix purpurea]
MSITQCHHFLDTKTFCSKQIDNFRHGHGGSWWISFNIQRFIDAVIFVPKEDTIVRATNYSYKITSGGGGEDVGARDTVRAEELEGSLSSSEYRREG